MRRTSEDARDVVAKAMCARDDASLPEDQRDFNLPAVLAKYWWFV